MKNKKEQPLIRENGRILVIQYRPIGDILLTSPIAEYLKTLYPQLKITFMIYKQYYPIIEHNPYIDDVILVDDIKIEDVSDFIDYMLSRVVLIKKLREDPYDIILDYIGNPSSAIMSFLSKAEYKVGYYKKSSPRTLLYNVKAEYDESDKYTILRKYDLLKPFNIGYQDRVLFSRVFLTQDELQFADDFFHTYNLSNKFTVILSPNSPREYKRWTRENYRDLAKILIDNYGARILILYGPGEREYCLTLHNQIGKGSMLLPDTTILQAAALIRNSSLAILNCSGVKHVSLAVGTPSITIFGKTKPENWHPQGVEWADYIKGEYIEGYNSFGIFPEQVMENIDDFIARGIVKLPV